MRATLNDYQEAIESYKRLTDFRVSMLKIDLKYEKFNKWFFLIYGVLGTCWVMMIVSMIIRLQTQL